MCEHTSMEVGEYLHKDITGNLEVLCPEKHPTGSDEVKGEDSVEPPFAFYQGSQRTMAGEKGVPDFVQSQKYAVDASPKDEIEGCTMPESTEEHGDKQVDILGPSCNIAYETPLSNIKAMVEARDEYFSMKKI